MNTKRVRSVVASCGVVLLVPTGMIAQNIVSNAAPNVDVPAFRLSAPLWTYGGPKSIAGAEVSRFGAVVIGADGSAYIAPTVDLSRGAIDVSVKAIDRRGNFIRQIGRSGTGPGEFRGITSIAFFARNTLFVYDESRGRITQLDSAGAIIRTLPQVRQAWCCLRDGTFGMPQRVTVRPSISPPGLMVRDTVMFTVANVIDTTRVAAPPIPLPAADAYVGLGSAEISTGDVATDLVRRPFGSDFIIRTAGSAFVYASTDLFEYRIIDPTGRHVRTVRATLPGVPIPRAIADSARAALCARRPPVARSQCETVAGQMAIPEFFPAIKTLVATDDGQVWLEGFQPVRSGARWLARFNRTGVLAGVLQVPGGYSVRAAHGDLILLEHAHSDPEWRALSLFRVEPASQ